MARADWDLDVFLYHTASLQCFIQSSHSWMKTPSRVRILHKGYQPKRWKGLVTNLGPPDATESNPGSSLFKLTAHAQQVCLFQIFMKVLYRSYCRSSLNSMQACKVKHKVHRRSMVSWAFKARADGSSPLLGRTSGFLVAQTFLYQKSLCWNCWEIFSSRV